MDILRAGVFVFIGISETISDSNDSTDSKTCFENNGAG